jgi:hypothetical protein
MDKATDFILMAAAEVAPVGTRLGILSAHEVSQIAHRLDTSRRGSKGYYIFPKQAQVFGCKE